MAGGHYDWQMCYWNLEDGGCAVNQGFETGPRLLFFIMKRENCANGVFLVGGYSITLEDFVDVSQLHPDIIDDVRENVESKVYTILSITTEGTAIKVHIDYEEVIEDFESIPYEALKS